MNIDKDLLETFVKYGNAITTKNNAATLDLLYPKMFDVIPRERLEESLTAAQADASVEVNIFDFSIESVELKLEEDNQTFVVFNSSCTATMKFAPILEDKSDIDETDGPAFRLEMLRAKYGESNVTFDETQNKITARTKNILLAIREQGQWRFLEVKEHFLPIYKKFLPKKISDQLVKFIPVEEPIEWPDEETLPQKKKTVTDYSASPKIDVLYLLGWEVNLNGDQQCNNFLATQATDRETFEYDDSGLELIFENKKLKKVYSYEDGKRKLRKLRSGEKAIRYPNLQPNPLLSLVDSPKGMHWLGGDTPKGFKLPECNSVVPFQYLGFIDNRDPNFSWLPYGIHLTHAIYLNVKEVFLDYTDPLRPKVINKHDVENADTEHEELNRKSEIIFKKQKFDFVCDHDYSPVGRAGIPNWIQYPAIPMCPKSGERMRFLCQFYGGPPTKRKNIKSDSTSFDELNFWGDGDLYVFFEPVSKVACYFIQNT